jgi:hypothetical protein
MLQVPLPLLRAQAHAHRRRVPADGTCGLPCAEHALFVSLPPILLPRLFCLSRSTVILSCRFFMDACSSVIYQWIERSSRAPVLDRRGCAAWSLTFTSRPCAPRPRLLLQSTTSSRSPHQFPPPFHAFLAAFDISFPTGVRHPATCICLVEASVSRLLLLALLCIYFLHLRQHGRTAAAATFGSQLE